jgi:hypothetical protein
MDQRKYKEAKKKVRTKKEFYEHLTVFSVMSVFFFLLNALTAFGSWWFYWPILGWGIGVLFHYFEVFGFPGIPDMSKEWEEQQIREEMKRLEQRNTIPTTWKMIMKNWNCPRWKRKKKRKTGRTMI